MNIEHIYLDGLHLKNITMLLGVPNTKCLPAFETVSKHTSRNGTTLSSVPLGIQKYLFFSSFVKEEALTIPRR